MGVGNKRTLTKTRRKKRDIDQIKADLLSPRHLALFKETKASEDLPGLGKWYCTECAKWFEGEATLVLHRRGKPHKRRVKQLREEPYTQKEAEAAIGLRTDNHGSQASNDNTDETEIDMET
ncbi:zinc finger-containing protein [Biscogniauxia mediterranea]|nr:zinc finger-containing protein [Biscogniauxia mediterranea]KAI1635785.1 zinc finger-containing protein [Biscogniauxia mediterranea]